MGSSNGYDVRATKSFGNEDNIGMKASIIGGIVLVSFIMLSAYTVGPVVTNFLEKAAKVYNRIRNFKFDKPPEQGDIGNVFVTVLLIVLLMVGIVGIGFMIFATQDTQA